MKRSKKILMVSTITLPLCVPLVTLSAEATKTTPPPAVLAKEVQQGFYPPAISEIFDSAKKNNLTGGWSAKIKIASQDYESMEPPRRAFQVGVTLAESAFLILDSDSPPTKDLIDLTYGAISAVSSIPEINSEVQKLRQMYESGQLKGKELVSEITRLINEVVPKITEATDPTMRDSGELLMAAGYFKALYLGTETLANSPSPTPVQLELVQAWKDIAEHSLEYLGKQTSPTFKDSVQVKNLVVALVKINPLLSKARGQLTKEDVAQIAAALKPLFG